LIGQSELVPARGQTHLSISQPNHCSLGEKYAGLEMGAALSISNQFGGYPLRLPAISASSAPSVIFAGQPSSLCGQFPVGNVAGYVGGAAARFSIGLRAPTGMSSPENVAGCLAGGLGHKITVQHYITTTSTTRPGESLPS